jgi:hypothetical protein
MAKKFQCLAQITVSSNTTAIDFTSIPGTFTDLKVELSARGDGYNANDLYVLFNGATSGYTGRYVMKDSSDPTVVTSTSATTKIISGFIPASQATSNTYGAATIYVPNYTGANYKQTSSEAHTENNGTIQWIMFSSGVWASTAAITQLSLNLNGGNFISGTTAYLYGIKNS